jgi:hypothetical protein
VFSFRLFCLPCQELGKPELVEVGFVGAVEGFVEMHKSYFTPNNQRRLLMAPMSNPIRITTAAMTGVIGLAAAIAIPTISHEKMPTCY